MKKIKITSEETREIREKQQNTMPLEIGTLENPNFTITIRQDININETLRNKENFRIIMDTRTPEAHSYNNLRITLQRTDDPSPHNDQ